VQRTRVLRFHIESAGVGVDRLIVALQREQRVASVVFIFEKPPAIAR
jgi:hypothetical protein